MSRRQRTGEQEFGSDSFLDIIANIVGILIILIVVAGARVANQVALPTVNADVVSATVEPSVDPESVLYDAAVPEPEQGPPLTPELDSEIEQLEAELTATRQFTATSEEELQDLMADLQQIHNGQQDLSDVLSEQNRLADSIFDLRDSLNIISTTSKSVQATLSSLTKQHKEDAHALNQVAYETRQLQEVLKDVEKRSPSADSIKHRLSPVSRTVTESELHFRMHKGRIAHMPIDALYKRAVKMAYARRDVVMKFGRYEGMVGPIGGFRFKYTVVRDVASTSVLQNGGNPYGMHFEIYELVPAETLEAEPVASALRIGSRFRQILESSEPETNITIWLYPDDFRHFRSIRELAHNLNLRVAARPLPDGRAIQGTPYGGKSQSQ